MEQVSYRVATRIEVIKHYGGKCVCCDESNLGFLTIDHINGGGTQHRKELGGGTAFYLWLLRHNFPPGYQVMCYNCNCGRALHDGICPHHLPVDWAEALPQVKRQTGKFRLREGRCVLCGDIFKRRKFRQPPERTVCGKLECRNKMAALTRWGNK